MEKIYQIIKDSLTASQIKYLNKCLGTDYSNTLNSYYIAGGWDARDITNTLLIPIWYHNKDKKLEIKSASQYQITGADAEMVINHLLSTYFSATSRHQILLLCVKRGNSFIDLHMKNHTEWKYLDRISLYLQLSAHHKIKVYQNAEKTVICTNLESTEFCRRVLSALPLILKDSFKFTEETTAIYRSLQTDPSGAETKEAFTNFIKQSKILEKQRLNELSEAIKKLSEYEYNQLVQQETSYNSQIQGYEAELVSLYNRLRETQSKITFYKPNLDTEELAQYIISNPNIVDYAAADNALLLAIEAPLEYIEVPAFKKLIQNAGSFIWPKWNNVPNSIAQHSEQFIQMLSDLFLKDRYTVYTRSEIILDFQKKEAYPFSKVGSHVGGDRCNAIRRAYPEGWSLSKRLNDNRAITPHMHIEFFDCWSGNKANITKCLNKNDIIGAIDIAVNTTKDINVTDSTVFNRFLQAGLWAPRTPDTSYYQYNTRPDLQFKTIYDNEQKRFRTFGDIFYNDYVKENITQFDINEDFSDII